MHQIKDGYLFKLIKVDGDLILLRIGSKTIHSIEVALSMSNPPEIILEAVKSYIWELFDCDRELGDFYEVASNDDILKEVVAKYYGLRMICIPDLFEALTWAIMGQQINLTFAYTLKKRFVEQFGENLTIEGETYWLFPDFTKIAHLHVDDLRKLQLTSRKAEYIIGVAKLMARGELSKESLLQKQDYQQVKKSLMSIRGVGAWTADYVMMKCLQFPDAFPIADVGLHQALKNQLGMERKPTIDEIMERSKNWEGWQAYATFYLWRSLYKKTI
ncbi:DNA glycosylase [Bacillus coahuilensis]|uniref:DNA glycosylase n=1 Tax=Bacillus coahuilensis TaxID=408580 RepID=UPI000185141D